MILKKGKWDDSQKKKGKWNDHTKKTNGIRGIK